MMRVSDLGQYLLLCHEEDTGLLLSTQLRNKQVLKRNVLCLYDISSEIQKSDEIANIIPNLSECRYLDKFFIWTPHDDQKRRQEVLDRFFELIADEFESLIDVPRNLENIRNLLGFLRQLIDPLQGSTIVDYGCGTGLSLEPASILNIKLIGVDSCPTMRQIASGRGMVVWGPGELARQPKDSVSGAFASYVLHLLPHKHGLKLLWARMKPGGILVANFHKNQGVTFTETTVREMQGAIRYLKSPIGSERHGSYVAFIKKK